jgi:Ca-activated chloride channel family protein
MNFLAPQLLLGLLLIPVAIGAYVWTQRRRSRYAVRFTNLELLANLAPRRPSWRRHVPPALYLAAIGGLLFALARPTMLVNVPREDATVILGIDVSGSMTAVDVSPTRLDAAKTAATAFLDQLPAGVRVGLVAFSSQPRTLVEPTADRGTVRTAIDGLAAKGGTAMGDALNAMLDLAETIQKADAAAASPGTATAPTPTPMASSAPRSSANPGTAATPAPSAGTARNAPLVAGILLSDGANSTGSTDPLDAANRAATLGVPVYTIALGTPTGQVQVQDDQGRLVTVDVPPDRATLASIAEVTGGTAFDAPTSADLQAVYDHLQSRIGYVPETQEVTSALAAAALVCVVAGAGLASMWFGRLP